ncbi:unnamed protein product [Moneuplotes crassus]|uniref:Uncharacterized protein n=4 Tax=Euplotes crassus TaxID=5936 RepID=A0AAD2DCF0_EUPCR|nr:unnamed protein product [Moneuplotes crassus]
MKILSNLQKALTSQAQDISDRTYVYYMILGIMIYQLISYHVLNLVPYAPLRIFTWFFFLLVFTIILIMIEEAISFTQAYHLVVLVVVQMLLPFGIHINPIFMAFLYEVLLIPLKNYVYNNLEEDSLLPLISMGAKERKSKNLELGRVIELAGLGIMTMIMMSIRDSFAPLYLSYISAPWCFFQSEFPILWVAISLHLFNLRNDIQGILSVFICCNIYGLLFETSNLISIFWHVLMSCLLVLGLKKAKILTIVLSLYGGMIFLIFSFFPSIQYSTTMYVFMINFTIIGAICITWLIYPPEILMYKPYYFPRIYTIVISQFFIMAVSFFYELTADDPYSRKDIYIQGVSFIFLSMLYFLLLFIVVYYFSYGWLYRSYFVDKMAIKLKKQRISCQDLKEIEQAVGREIDISLRDEIDERMQYVDCSDYDHLEAPQPFMLSKISLEDIFFRLSITFSKNLGPLALNLYDNYYSDSISSMLNPTVILSILILNLILSKFSIFLYFVTALLTVNMNNTGIFKFFGRISLKLFRYESPYSILEENDKPEEMPKDEYLSNIKLDMFCKYGLTYFLTLFTTFLYPVLGKLFFYRLLEGSLEVTIHICDIFNIEIHFVRYIYYGIIDNSGEQILMSDVLLLCLILIPIAIALIEFLSVPSLIKWYEYEGRVITFGAPLILLVLFIYDNEAILCIAIAELVMMLFVLWYILEQEDDKTDRRMTKKYGRSWEKEKQDYKEKAQREMLKQLGGAGSALGMFTNS